MPEKIYTTYQIGKFCQVNIRTVIRWIETGKLKAYSTPGGHRRVKWSDLITFLTQNRMPIPHELEEAKRKKILVVDDDIDFLEIATKILEGIPDAEINSKGSFIKAGLRNEFDPAIVSVSVLATIIDKVCIRAKIVLGGVSAIPYRAVYAEEMLNGKIISDKSAEEAAQITAQTATPLPKNTYKVDLIESITKRAILNLI